MIPYETTNHQIWEGVGGWFFGRWVWSRAQLSSFKMRLHRQGTLERVAPGCIEAAAARVWLGDPETTCAVFEHPPTTKRMEWAKKKVGTYPMQETQSNKETQMSFIKMLGSSCPSMLVAFLEVHHLLQIFLNPSTTHPAPKQGAPQPPLGHLDPRVLGDRWTVLGRRANAPRGHPGKKNDL